MVIQLRPSDGSDKRLYCPERDVVYLFPALVRRMMYSFDDKDLEEVQFLGHYETLVDAGKALAHFWDIAGDGNVPSEDVLKLCGFASLDLQTRLTISHRFFQLFLQSYIIYLRDISLPGERLPSEIEDCYKHLLFVETYQSWGSLRRGLYRAVRRIKRWFGALRYPVPGDA